MTVIAHLSDLHFGTEQPAVAAALLRILAAEPPDLIVVSGDLTQNATWRQFRAARAFLDRLPAPWLAVPGNHDIVGHRLLEMVLRPFRRWTWMICDDLDPEWSNGLTVVKGINTARPFGPYLNWSRGRFSANQVETLARSVVDGRLLTIACHHPLAFGHDRAKAYPLATRAEAVLAALSRHSRSLVLAGHRHRSHVSLWSATAGERTVEAGATARAGEVLIVHAGTASSDRLRGEVNSWNRVSLRADGIEVEALGFDGSGWSLLRRVAVVWPQAPQ
ncbi:MAG: metallophosphoesterase family protein [Phreatobacter sp.]